MSRNMGLMLKGALDALGAQLEHVRGERRYEEACLSGMKFYKGLYESEELVEEVRKYARANRWGPATRGALALLRRHPRALATHAGRRMRRVIFGGGKASH
jgi:hypothetical protein